jgi:hypothetical protein
VKKTIILLIVGLMVLTSCGKRGELLKVNNIIATKEEKAQTDTAKGNWHALTDFASEYVYAIGCIVAVIAVGSVVAWNWGKWFGNDLDDEYTSYLISYLSYPDDDLRMIINAKIDETNYLSGIKNRAANTALARRSGIPLKIPDDVNVALLLQYSSRTTKYLLDFLKKYDTFNSDILNDIRRNNIRNNIFLKKIVEFILTCRGESIPEEE